MTPRFRPPPGANLLEVAAAYGIPCVAACDGDAKCSTCRVLIVDGLEACEARTPDEIPLARRLGFGRRVRLACQTTINASVVVRRLVLDPDDTRRLDQRRPYSRRRRGRELDVAVLFTDIRDFTRLAATLPPYDSIHVLERFMALAVEAVENRRGLVTSYMGDGFMALFGADGEDAPHLAAVAAGWGIIGAVDHLQPYVAQLYDEPLRVGVGVHCGTAVVGSVGPGGGITAVGDTVNVASRIEQATKMLETPFLISDETRRRVADAVTATELEPLAVSGRAEPLRVWVVEDVDG